LESNGRSTIIGFAQGDSECATLETLDNKSSCQSSITNYSQVVRTLQQGKDKAACLETYLAIPAGAETNPIRTFLSISGPLPCLMMTMSMRTSPPSSSFWAQQQQSPRGTKLGRAYNHRPPHFRVVTWGARPQGNRSTWASQWLIST
jgi:hypothetical protein